jgi:L-alanine-DL-glutamate epimerase-like enolase superfamily enzyme
MELTLSTRELHPRRVFRIARARRRAVCNVFLRLEHDGISGYGEASPNSFYNETEEIVAEKLTGAREAIRRLRLTAISDIERAWADLWSVLQPSRAAQCALDLALWDWLAKSQGRTVAELVWGEAPHPVTSFATIGLSTPDELPEKLDELRGFPRIKIKSDAAADLAPVRAVRAHSHALLAVDANCSWNAADLPSLVKELREVGVTFVEQPFAPENDARLSRGEYALPIVADESSVVEDDVARVPRHFDGFNIKLVKCGGITPARRMIQRGREAGCQLMVGCMLESSLLIAAGAVIAQRTDYADLDGAWLLGDDPCEGWTFSRGLLTPPAATGLGISANDELWS